MDRHAGAPRSSQSPQLGRPASGASRAASRLGAAALLCLACTSLHAEIPASAAGDIDAAYADLDALATRTRATGDLPRWSDPEGAKVLSRLWDVKAILGAPPYSSADVKALLEIGAKETAVFKTYLLFTAKPGELPDTAHNTYVYQDETARSGAFMLRTFAAQLSAIDDFARKLPPGQMTEVRRGGVRQMHLGITQMITGMTTMLRSPAMRPENRIIIIDALADSADTISAEMGPADRVALVAQIDAALSALAPDEQARLGKVKTALERTDCTGLCTFD